MLINKQVFNPKRYSSGELKLINSELNKYIINNKVDILYEDDFSIFELLIILKYYKSKKVIIDLTLPYLPYQRMDHKGRDELCTLEYVSAIFNELELNSISIGEPHCEINEFNNSKKISYINLVKDKVFKEINFNEDEDYIVLTDKGGYKRYHGLSKNQVYFNKERDKETGLIIKQEIVGNIDPTKKILIVDDIISTGDTIINIINYLKAKEVYILCGHLENNIYNERLLKCKCVKKIYSTNSLKKEENKKTKLFDVRGIIYE